MLTRGESLHVRYTFSAAPLSEFGKAHDFLCSLKYLSVVN